MKFKFMLICLVFCQSAFPERATSTIHSIDQGHLNEPHLIRFDNGRSSFISSEKSALLAILTRSFDQSEPLKLTINKHNEIISATAHSDFKSFGEEEKSLHDKNIFTPSVLQKNSDALKVFRKMRRDYSVAGECFNRAHVWSYEEFKRTGLNSMKVFMFFTEKYIRKYKFNWWFHVTPAVYVSNTKSLKTLDRRYTSGPRQPKTWSDSFIKSKRRCKEVTKFDDFWLNQEKEDCFHIISSMYYVIPRDLEKRDFTGIEKTDFIEKEIRRAYRNGFGKTYAQ